LKLGVANYGSTMQTNIVDVLYATNRKENPNYATYQEKAIYRHASSHEFFVPLFAQSLIEKWAKILNFI